MASIPRAHERNDRDENWEVGLAYYWCALNHNYSYLRRIIFQEDVSRFKIQPVRVETRRDVHRTTGLHACRHAQVEIPQRVLGERRKGRPAAAVLRVRPPGLAELRLALDETGRELLPCQTHQ